MRPLPGLPSAEQPDTHRQAAPPSAQGRRKAFDLLRLLAQNPNRLLTKEEILESQWCGIHVTDGLVREYVHDLRLALDDDPRHPRFIENVRGRGYRFLGGIEMETLTAGAAEPRGRATGVPTVLVLPIENLAVGERWERFCRGMRDDLITELSRYPDFVVIASGASLADRYTNAEPHAVGADYLLRGSMQASESMLRMNLYLVDTQHGRNIWSERYDGASMTFSRSRAALWGVLFQRWEVWKGI